MNREAIVCLEAMLLPSKATPSERLARARELLGLRLRVHCTRSQAQHKAHQGGQEAIAGLPQARPATDHRLIERGESLTPSLSRTPPCPSGKAASILWRNRLEIRRYSEVRSASTATDALPFGQRILRPYAAFLVSLIPANPTRPEPKSQTTAGTGTGE